MARGVPRMCIAQTPQPISTAKGSMAGSPVKPVMSLMISAPAWTACLRHERLRSIDRDGRAGLRAQRSDHGHDAAQLLLRSTGSENGRVLSPPTSRMSAPSAIICSPCSTAVSASKKCPPSEKLSGVTLIMPISNGNRPAASVRVRSRQ